MGRAKDLTGKRFGNLVAIEPTEERCNGGIKWKCRCDCGNITYVSSSNLCTAHIHSCGCSRIKDITGQRFGRLIALELTEQRKGRNAVWKCLCECGNLVEVSSNNLCRGETLSCGCYKKENVSKLFSVDLTGQRFERLLVIVSTNRRSKSGSIVWECLCDCGNMVYVRSNSLLSGSTKSCGCLQRDSVTTHGLSHTKEYISAQNRKRYELKTLYDSECTTELELALEEFFPACVICGMTREEHIEKYGKDLHKDHVLPLSRGHGLKPGNAVILCRTHNGNKLAKSLDKLPQDWQDKILEAAKDFEEYWLSIHEETIDIEK